MAFDPLSTNHFAASPSTSASPPPWPTTPHTPEALSPNFGIPTPKRSTPAAAPQESPNPFGREPQIYGQPGAGLISPRETKFSNGQSAERAEPYVRMRITGMDRNRKDILVRFDAQTNLPNFNGTTYRNISRSYVECQRFAEQIAWCNPQTIIPALPLPQTSAPTDEEDDRLVKVMLQRWFTRICEDPVVMRDEEVRSFIESDFGYQPTIRPKRKAPSSFSLLRRNTVPDEDSELQSARFELTRLETQFFEAAKAVDKLSRARKGLSVAHAEMGDKLMSVATAESVHPGLGAAFRKFGRAWHSLGDAQHAHSVSESVMIADAFGYQGLNSRAAKETLVQRAQVLEEHQASVKSTIAKRRHIERLKASSNIRPEKVDEALEELEEAQQIENIHAQRVHGITQNLHKALVVHSRHAHEDIASALIEHARASLIYQRTIRRELEALRTDVKNITEPHLIKPRLVTGSSMTTVPSSALGSGLPTPSPRPSAISSSNSFGFPGHSAAGPSSAPGTPVDGLSRSSTPANGLAQPPRTPGFSSSPLAQSQHAGAAGPSPSSVPSPFRPQSPLATSSPRSPGFKHVEGTQSMYVEPPLRPGIVTDPLGSGITPTSASLRGGFGSAVSSPAGSIGRSGFMQPARGRIDQREAAKKLANFL